MDPYSVLIDHYFSGTMSDAELEEFWSKMDSDKALEKAFQFRETLMLTLQDKAARQQEVSVPKRILISPVGFRIAAVFVFFALLVVAWWWLRLQTQIPEPLAMITIETEDDNTEPRGPSSNKGLYEEAIGSFEASEFRNAIKQFEKISREDTTNYANAQYHLGKSLYHLGEYETALTIFTRVETLSQQGFYKANLYEVKSDRMIALTYVNLCQPEKAIIRLDELIARNPSRFQAEQQLVKRLKSSAYRLVRCW